MTHTVLVIENHADLGSAIASALSRGEYDCECVRNAEDAVVKLRDHDYEAILLAPKLPLKDDPVVHYLLENQPGLLPRVILMTDPADDGDTGELRVLSKPFNREQLFAQLSSASPAAVE